MLRDWLTIFIVMFLCVICGGALALAIMLAPFGL